MNRAIYRGSPCYYYYTSISIHVSVITIVRMLYLHKLVIVNTFIFFSNEQKSLISKPLLLNVVCFRIQTLRQMQELAQSQIIRILR